MDLVEGGEGVGDVSRTVEPKQVEDLEEDGIADGVVDLIAHLAMAEDLAASEDGQMLRQVGLFDVQGVLEAPCGEFTLPEGLDDRDTGRVGERLKDVGFELSNGVWHSDY